jgi:Domain of unknown function (DUF4148)
MFAKQAAFAALTLAIAGGAFAQNVERNVFDTETYQRMPAAESNVSREAVRAEFIAQREAKNIAEFRPQAWYFAQNNDSAPALMALFSSKTQPVVAQAGGRTRAEVRAEYLAARANGEVNPFDTETYQRIPAGRVPAPTALAQK